MNKHHKATHKPNCVQKVRKKSLFFGWFPLWGSERYIAGFKQWVTIFKFENNSEDYVKSTWIWRVLVSIWEKKRRRSFSVYLGSSAEFISMIFGSFGKFWIGLCVQKNFLGFFFIEKKSQTLFRHFFGRPPTNFFKDLESSLYKAYKGNPPKP